jgi:hypothetical protein
MDERQLKTLKILYNLYWENDEIDVDLANKIANNIPSLIIEIERLRTVEQSYQALLSATVGLRK